MKNEDFLFTEDVSEIDPDTDRIIAFEEERQTEKLILIPSESICPKAVRQALGCVFTDIYAEGYPSLRMTKYEREYLLDFKRQLSYHWRYADRRYYKGCEFVDFIEALAMKRVVELFATNEYPAEQIFANVQPLSGAAANNAVYDAFLKPGDTVMGMSLTCGGHLTHGGEANRSGKYYNIVSYLTDRDKKIDYDDVKKLALEYKPEMIIGGYSAYPWTVDWHKFREIADAVGAILMADIAHPAGLVIAGKFPNPVGIADVTTFTTHKTLCGPRGAVILTTDEEKAKQVDRAVFPGEQGGPHINNIAAKAVCFKIAQTEKFRKLQENIAENAQYLADALQHLGLKLAYGGTDTHMLLIDLKNAKTPTGRVLKGEIASRILDMCGITCNKNALAGDEDVLDPTGIRLGTPWITQRGIGKDGIEKLAELIHKVLTNIHTFSYMRTKGEVGRGKIDQTITEEVKKEVAEIVQNIGREYHSRTFTGVNLSITTILEITSERATAFLQCVTTNNIFDLKIGQSQNSFILDKDGKVIDGVVIQRLEPDVKTQFPHKVAAELCPATEFAQSTVRERYLMATHPEKTERVKRWLRSLSDGYVLFDEDDIFAKVDGPAVIGDVHGESNIETNLPADGDAAYLYDNGFKELFDLSKPYFVGATKITKAAARLSPAKVAASSSPATEFSEVAAELCPATSKEEKPLKKSCLYDEHLKLTRKTNMVPFAGWIMPVSYGRISDEHKAVRETTGIFDVTHMGILEISGESPTRFLDLITTNYIPRLKIGQCQYSHILDVDGIPMDDVMIYKRAQDTYMMVVNAVNTEKIKAWLNAVNSKNAIIDRDNPLKEVDATVVIRDLKDSSSGEDQKVDIALQGQNSLAILLKLMKSTASCQPALAKLKKSEFVETNIGDIKVIISRTGYTGEDIGFELYLHPDSAPKLWNLLLECGKEYGIKPAGLGARDSTRTEAGLPLYGHELSGENKITSIEAGYGGCVKLHKPFFVGRKACLKEESDRKMCVVRFRMNRKGIKMIRPAHPVVNKRGECIGSVTSCALDGEGFQVGMAYVNIKYSDEGTQIGMYALPQKAVAEKPKDKLDIGDRVLLHEEAAIQQRFMTPEVPVAKVRNGEDVD